MKMIVVGPPRQGKSTLLEILQTGRAPQAAHSEATIRTTKWELQRPAGSKAKVKDGQRAEPVGGRDFTGGPFSSSLETPGFSPPGVQGRLQGPVCAVYCSNPAPAKDSKSTLYVTLQFCCGN